MVEALLLQIVRALRHTSKTFDQRSRTFMSAVLKYMEYIKYINFMHLKILEICLACSDKLKRFLIDIAIVFDVL